MTEIILGYLLNASWQAPLLVIGALVLARTANLEAAARFRLFVGVLASALVLPAAPHAWPASVHGAAKTLARPTSAEFAGPTGRLFSAATMSATVHVDVWIGRAMVLAVALVAGVSFARLVYGVSCVWRIQRRSKPFTSHAAVWNGVLDFAVRRGARAPSIAQSSDISGPAVVGVWRPVILVPPFFAGLPSDDAKAALLHECAHVIRRDYLVNMICEAMMLPLAWHPAVRLLKTRLGAAREIACDQLAANEMSSPRAYAQRLVDLARTIDTPSTKRSGLALALFHGGDLEVRIRALIEPPSVKGLFDPLRAILAALGVTAIIGVAVALIHVSAVVPHDEVSLARFVGPRTAMKPTAIGPSAIVRPVARIDRSASLAAMTGRRLRHTPKPFIAFRSEHAYAFTAQDQSMHATLAAFHTAAPAQNPKLIAAPSGPTRFDAILLRSSPYADNQPSLLIIVRACADTQEPAFDAVDRGDRQPLPIGADQRRPDNQTLAALSPSAPAPMSRQASDNCASLQVTPATHWLGAV